MSEQIKFYRANEPYGVFSNFDTKHPIMLFGKVWPSTEHYFQAMKFLGTDDDWAEQIRIVEKPRFAASMGRDRNHPLRPNWENEKYHVMKLAVMAKFTQHEDCKKTLLSTDGIELIEHTTNDNVWADGGDGSGQNLLGKILMEVRDEIRKAT
jgi:ribA/ribD-fused uncharacterized protein